MHNNFVILYVKQCILWFVYTREKQFNVHVVKITTTYQYMWRLYFMVLFNGIFTYSTVYPVYCLRLV